MVEVPRSVGEEKNGSWSREEVSVEVGQATRSPSFSGLGPGHEIHRRISSPVGLRKRGNYLRQRGYENYRPNSSELRLKFS